MSGRISKRKSAITDKLLIRQFSLLMEENMDFACNIAGRFLTQPADIQDAVQNAFIKAWLSFSKYRPDKALFSTWFYSIIKNECIDRIRSQKKDLHIPADEVSVSDLSQQADSYGELDLYQRIIILADSFPATQKETFILRDIEGLSIREVVKKTGQSEGSVKTNLYLARKKIREWMEKGKRQEGRRQEGRKEKTGIIIFMEKKPRNYKLKQ